MKKKAFIGMIILLLASSGLFMFNSCDECAGLAESLPDLITNALELKNSNAIEAGDLVDLAISINNTIDATSQCGTAIANASKYDYQVFFSEDGIGNWEDWQRVGTATYQAYELIAGNSFDEKNPVEFKVPGFYYLLGVSDSKTEVVERNEDNNDKELEGGSASKTKSLQTGVIYVKTSDKFEKMKKTGEKIPYVVFHKDDNFIEQDVEFYK